MKHKNPLFAHKPIKKKAASSPLPESLSITGLSHEGRGIAKHDGKTIFVAGALPDEIVKFRITDQHRRYDEAVCTEVITPSEQRQTPACEYYEKCGGCDLQHLDHAHQISNKQTLVLDQLARLGKVEPTIVESPIASEPWGYRRSSRLGINQLNRDGSVLVGFRRKGSNKLISIDSCPVLAPELNQLISPLHTLLEQQGDVKHITQAELTLSQAEPVIVIRAVKQLNQTLKQALIDFAQNQACQVYIDDGQQQRCLNSETEIPAPLSYSLPNESLTLAFKPSDFIQVNARVNQEMLTRAMVWLDLQQEDRVLDLFCGIGNFSLPTAKRVAEVVGIEGVEEMVNRAAQNAENNALNNCTFHRADLSKDLTAMPWYVQGYQQGFDKIILDPPRTGALEIIKQLDKHKAAKILYVSCNPAALARDAQALIEQGYQATRFCVMDMFPQTSHVESMMLFEKTP